MKIEKKVMPNPALNLAQLQSLDGTNAPPISSTSGDTNMRYSYLHLVLMISLPAVIATFSHAHASHQLCQESIVTSVSAAVKIENESVIEAKCKVWPYKNNIVISAVAYQIGNDEKYSNGRTIKLAIALYDSSSAKLIAHYMMDSSDEGGIRLAQNGINIDAARYDISPGIRAFAIRLNKGYYTSKTLAEGGSSDYFNLFIFDGKRIRHVVVELPLYHWTMHPKKGSYSEEDPTSEKAQFSVVVANTKTKGYRDLLFTTKIRPSGRTLTSKISYDGERYSVDSFNPSLW